MKLKIEGLTFYVDINKSNNLNKKIPIIFLHGFMGNSLDWEGLSKLISDKYRPIKIDLIGHGKSSKPSTKKYYSAKSIIKQINLIVKKLRIEKFVLVGYSMGGRAAIAYSLKYPKNILALILESSTFGIKNIAERRKRRNADFVLSQNIITGGIKKFLEKWIENPMFGKLKIPLSIIKKREITNTAGYQNILTEFSQGKTPNYWKQINKISFPLLLITGANDKKFTKINCEIKKLVPTSQHITVKNTGHNVHLEKPQVFANFVNKFLKQI